jgi:hypothetical protein
MRTFMGKSCIVAVRISSAWFHQNTRIPAFYTSLIRYFRDVLTSIQLRDVLVELIKSVAWSIPARCEWSFRSCE